MTNSLHVYKMKNLASLILL